LLVLALAKVKGWTSDQALSARGRPAPQVPVMSAMTVRTPGAKAAQSSSPILSALEMSVSAGVDLGWQGHHCRPGPGTGPALRITHQQVTSKEPGRDVAPGPARGRNLQDRPATTRLMAD
jgi:hypothetical protein